MTCEDFHRKDHFGGNSETIEEFLHDKGGFGGNSRLPMEVNMGCPTRGQVWSGDHEEYEEIIINIPRGVSYIE